MAYPNYLSRVTNWQQAFNAGLPFSYANLDAEANNTVTVVNAINNWMRGVTDSSGRLINLAAATAQALAGAQQFTATAGQTLFTTSITYDSAFSNLNVGVFVNGARLSTASVTPSNSSGSLAVTIPARTAGDIVIVEAYSSGAGLLTRLQSTALNDGASLIGINDAAGRYTATNVESALLEVMLAVQSLSATIGSVGQYLKASGSVAMTGDFNAGNNRLTNVADGSSSTDAATVGQLTAATSSINELYTQFIRTDGSTPFTGNINAGSHRLINLSTPTASTDAATKAYVDASGTSLAPAGAIIACAATSIPSGWLACDGSTYDGTLTQYLALWNAIGTVFGGTSQSSFKVPDLRGLTIVGAGATQTYTDPVLGSITTSSRTVGDKFGEEKHAMTTAEMPAHTHKYYWGNGPGSGPGADGEALNGDATQNAATTSTGSNTPFNVCQPSIAIRYLIKY